MTNQNKVNKTESQGSVPKTVRISEEKAEQLENLAESWYGSSYKQGQVVDDLIDTVSEEEGGKLMQMIEDIHNVTVSGKDGFSLYSGENTENENSETSNVREEHPELQEKAGDEPINPDEYDLSCIKGTSGIDVPDVVYSVLMHTHETDVIKRDDILDILTDDIGYAKSSSYTKCNAVFEELVEIPSLKDAIDKHTTDMAKSRTEVDTKKFGFSKKHLIRISSPCEWMKEDVDVPLTDGGYTLEPETASRIIADMYGFVANEVSDECHKGTKNYWYQMLVAYNKIMESSEEIEMEERTGNIMAAINNK
ncbi:hypothetical protein [Natranaeroarchaeum aerophilus]|uniref:Uncharacterized protein n=1 Tax=Natranaeroarchaeum aerophilus TaxID=2917711 RepID=A0AAE3FT02_9EURY|nr:hypothetical protein [Natranaeroarchaeum aerophilus]MCL9814398.1 hypothetical protein [Natranaeroarchaeum aerophilus]